MYFFGALKPRYCNPFAIFLCLFLSSLFGDQLWAQKSDYKPAQVSCSFSSQETNRQAQITQKQLAKLEEGWRKDADILLQERNEEVKSLCSGQLLITDPAFTAPFQRIFNHIVKANNLQSVPMQLYLGKQPWPNAFSAGEGSLVLQVGLLPVVRNEAELAFVICHEIAHYTLDHSTQGLAVYFEQLNNSETRKKLKQLSKQEYGAKSVALQILEKMTFSNRRHSRFNETSADSLGLVYLHTAGYDTRIGAASMQSLDSADGSGSYVSISKHFNLPGFPFEERWIKKSKTLGSGKLQGEAHISDSLKTHPDCAKRFAAMEHIIDAHEWTGGNTALLPADSFASIKKQAAFEQADSWYRLGMYDMALFEALRLADDYPDFSYGNVLAGKVLQAMCNAYGKFNLSKNVRPPSVDLYSENFNELLRMMQRLSLDEMIRLTTCYVEYHAKKWQPVSGAYRDMAAELPALKKLQQ